METTKTPTVLVTGGSGYVGSYCLIALLKEGYQVRTTIRSLQKADSVREMLKKGGATQLDRLSFVAADLLKDEGWSAAVEGCDFVLHVASPFPLQNPENEDELIRPAVDGTLRVLRAAHAAGVQRVVVTSSFAAIGYSNDDPSHVFTEADWTDVNTPKTSAYVKSKTLAEKAAWDFIATEGKGMELSVVNPVGIFGPILNDDLSSSVSLFRQLLDGTMKKGAPDLSFGLVDVRDLAVLQLKAMTSPAANGERFLAVSGDSMSLLQIAGILKSNLGEQAALVPVKQVPSWLLRIAGLFSKKLSMIVPQLGKVKKLSNQKAQEVLGWQPRPVQETIIATAQSMISQGLVNR